MADIVIPFFPGEAEYDRLPVQILRCDKKTPPNLRIYAQGQLCRTSTAVEARIWTFEGEPAKSVRLQVEFRAGEHTLTAYADFAGNVRCISDGVQADDAVTASFFAGEDLQGVYRGVILKIDAGKFFSLLAADSENPSTIKAEVNLLRVGESVSSLAPQGQYIPVLL